MKKLLKSTLSLVLAVLMAVMPVLAEVKFVSVESAEEYVTAETPVLEAQLQEDGVVTDLYSIENGVRVFLTEKSTDNVFNPSSWSTIEAYSYSTSTNNVTFSKDYEYTFVTDVPEGVTQLRAAVDDQELKSNLGFNAPISFDSNGKMVFTVGDGEEYTSKKKIHLIAVYSAGTQPDGGYEIRAFGLYKKPIEKESAPDYRYNGKDRTLSVTYPNGVYDVILNTLDANKNNSIANVVDFSRTSEGDSDTLVFTLAENVQSITIPEFVNAALDKTYPAVEINLVNDVNTIKNGVQVFSKEPAYNGNWTGTYKNVNIYSVADEGDITFSTANKYYFVADISNNDITKFGALLNNSEFTDSNMRSIFTLDDTKFFNSDGVVGFKTTTDYSLSANSIPYIRLYAPTAVGEFTANKFGLYYKPITEETAPTYETYGNSVTVSYPNGVYESVIYTLENSSDISDIIPGAATFSYTVDGNCDKLTFTFADGANKMVIPALVNGVKTATYPALEVEAPDYYAALYGIKVFSVDATATTNNGGNDSLVIVHTLDSAIALQQGYEYTWIASEISDKDGSVKNAIRPFNGSKEFSDYVKNGTLVAGLDSKYFTDGIYKFSLAEGMSLSLQKFGIDTTTATTSYTFSPFAFYYKPTVSEQEVKPVYNSQDGTFSFTYVNGIEEETLRAILAKPSLVGAETAKYADNVLTLSGDSISVPTLVNAAKTASYPAITEVKIPDDYAVLYGVQMFSVNTTVTTNNGGGDSLVDNIYKFDSSYALEPGYEYALLAKTDSLHAADVRPLVNGFELADQNGKTINAVLNGKKFIDGVAVFELIEGQSFNISRLGIDTATPNTEYTFAPFAMYYKPPVTEESVIPTYNADGSVSLKYVNGIDAGTVMAILSKPSLVGADTATYENNVLTLKGSNIVVPELVNAGGTATYPEFNANDVDEYAVFYGLKEFSLEDVTADLNTKWATANLYTASPKISLQEDIEYTLIAKTKESQNGANIYPFADNSELFDYSVIQYDEDKVTVIRDKFITMLYNERSFANGKVSFALDEGKELEFTNLGLCVNGVESTWGTYNLDTYALYYKPTDFAGDVTVTKTGNSVLLTYTQGIEYTALNTILAQPSCLGADTAKFENNVLTLTGDKILVPALVNANKTASYLPVNVSINTVSDKVEIRTNAPSGLRVKASITTALQGEAYEFGFIVARAEQLGTNELTHSFSNYVQGVSYREGEIAAKIFEYGAENIFFTGLLTGIPDYAYEDNFVCRPYVVKDGHYYYGDAVIANIYDIAKKIQTSENYSAMGEDEKAYIDGIVSKVEASQTVAKGAYY